MENILALLGFKDNIKDGNKLWTQVVSPYFIYGGFTVDNYDGNYEDFSVGLIKSGSHGLFEITMLRLAYASKLGEEIGCMEGTSIGVSKIAIKGITE